MKIVLISSKLFSEQEEYKVVGVAQFQKERNLLGIKSYSFYWESLFLRVRTYEYLFVQTRCQSDKTRLVDLVYDNNSQGWQEFGTPKKPSQWWESTSSLRQKSLSPAELNKSHSRIDKNTTILSTNNTSKKSVGTKQDFWWVLPTARLFPLPAPPIAIDQFDWIQAQQLRGR